MVMTDLSEEALVSPDRAGVGAERRIDARANK